MYKVLLVDDEPFIREGLRAIIDWEKFGFSVAGDAAGAAEALAKHGQTSPGLMVVDIKMPGMNGLQLIEEIRKKDAECRFIILSGYGEFEYAKQAIANGVSGYILKPVDEQELVSLVGRVKEELEGQEAAERAGRQAQAGRRKELLAGLVAGSITDSELVELSGGQAPVPATADQAREGQKGCPSSLRGE